MLPFSLLTLELELTKTVLGVRIGITSASELDRRWGTSKRETGEHSSSGRRWTLKDGTTGSADGGKSDPPGNTIIEGFSITSWPGTLGKNLLGK